MTVQLPNRAWAEELAKHRETALAALAEDGSWSGVRRALAAYLEADGRLLLEQLPVLRGLGSAPLQLPELSTRSRNMLLRQGLTTWASFGVLTPADIVNRRNAGRTTLNEILEYSLNAALSSLVTLGAVYIPDEARLPWHAQLEFYVKASRTRQDLQMMATWAVRSLGATTIGEVINPRLPLHSVSNMPAEIASAWQRLSVVSLAELADAHLAAVSLDTLIEDLVNQLSEPERAVVTRRLLPLSDAPTLDAVGRDLNVTRQRIRQIQQKARKKLQEHVKLPPNAPLLWAAHRLGQHIGAMASVDDGEVSCLLAEELGRPADTADPGAQWLLMLAGPYSLKGDWLVRQDVTPPEPSMIERYADDAGVVDLEGLAAALIRLPMSGWNAQRWVHSTGLTREFDGRTVLWTGNVVDKMRVILSATGEPADAEWLVAMVGAGHNVRAARGRLFDDPRFMRVSKRLWALRSWGFEEYTGIADELKQRIEEAGGEARLSDLTATLVDSFGVRKTSVRLYATAPMFVLEEGMLRMRRVDEPYPVPTDIGDVKGCFSLDGRLSYLLTVDKDVLRGSGQTCPAALAGALARCCARPASRVRA